MDRREKVKGGYVAKGWRWQHEDSGVHFSDEASKALAGMKVVSVDIARSRRDYPAAVFYRKVQLRGRGIARWVRDDALIAQVREEVARLYQGYLGWAVIMGNTTTLLGEVKDG